MLLAADISDRLSPSVPRALSFELTAAHGASILETQQDLPVVVHNLTDIISDWFLRASTVRCWSLRNKTGGMSLLCTYLPSSAQYLLTDC